MELLPPPTQAQIASGWSMPYHADAHLEIAHHLRERVGAYHGTDAVNGILITVQVRFKGGIHSFLQALEAVRDRHHLGTQDFHAGDVRSLLGNIYRSHVNFAFQAEEGGGCSQRHAMLSWAPVWFKSSLFR